MDRVDRPLSPFWVYRWQITNTLSILHRFTGLALSIGLIILVAWLVAVAGGEPVYTAAAERVFGAPWFKLPLIGWTFCFFYHFANGIRHLVWDVGGGFERAQIRIGGWIVIVAAVLATTGYSLLVIF
jgi:succinate dehydrogenase cytochrome b subunit